MKSFKKILLWALCFAMLLPFAASAVSASPIADEDFENMTNSDLAEPDWVGGGTATGSGGVVIEKAPDAIKYVKEEAPTTTTKALGSVSGAGGSEYDQGTLTLSGSLPATKEISFDIYATDSSYKGSLLQLGDSSGYSITLIFFKPSANSSYSSYGDAFLVGYAGNGSSIVAPSYHAAYTPVLNNAMKNGEYMKLGEWHNIRIVITTGASTAALYIDNYKVADIKASASISTISKINYMRMSWDAGSQGIYLDNLKLTGTDGKAYYYEDFEGFAEGSAPASEWVMTTGKNYKPLSITEFDIPNKALNFVKTANTPKATLTVTESLPDVTNAVSFDVYVDNSTSETGLRFEINGGSNRKAIINIFRPKTTDAAYNGKMMVGYFDNAHTKLETLSYNTRIVPALSTDSSRLLTFDRWYNVRLEWARGATTGTLYIDGDAVCNTVVIDNPSVNAVDTIILQPGNSGGNDDTYIDNVKLYGEGNETPYYSEDFESTLAGCAPSGWTMGTVGMLVGIKEVPVKMNKAVEFNRPALGTSVNSVITVDSSVPTFTSEASFRVYVASTSWKGALIDFNNGSSLKVRLGFADGSLSGDPTTYKDKVYMYTYDTSNSTVIQPTYENNKAILPVAILEKSAWYDVTVKFSEGSSRVDVYVNGELALRTAFDAVPAKKAIDKIVIQNMSSNNGEIIYFDDIKLYGSGQTTPYYSNDFENETVGVAASSMTHGSGKVAMKIVETPIEVVEEESKVNFVTVKGTNAYKVYQNGSGQVMSYRKFIATDKVRVSFDYLATAASVDSGAYISLSSGEGSGSWLYSIRIFRNAGVDSPAALTYYNGSSYQALAEIEFGVWYNISMELENGKAKVYLDGNELATLTSSTKTVDGIFFGTTSGRSAVDTYYIDNLKFIGAEGIEMNDTPIEFTDSFDAEPTGYSYLGSGTHSVEGSKLILNGAVTATRTIENTRSGRFGLTFSADKLEGMTLTLYQDSTTAVAVSFEADGTILCKRKNDWVHISDKGKLEAGKTYELSLDLAPDRNANYFIVRLGDEIVATAIYEGSFSFINAMSVSAAAGSSISVDSLYLAESDGVIKMPDREESSPEVYLPLVIEGARTMYKSGDTAPLNSSLDYLSGQKLVLDSKNTSIGVDLGSVQAVNAIRITGSAEISRPANHTNYAVYQSDDNENWVKVKGFSMNHFTENGVSVALFEVTGVEARYLKVLSYASSGKFEVASVRAEARIARQWKMAGYAMYAMGDTDPIYTPMTRELYDNAISIKKGDSIGINFGINSHVEAIELVGEGLSSLDEGAFELYQSNDNEKYTLVENTILSYDTRDGKQVYRLTFDDTVCGYLKLHAVKDMSIKLDDLYDGLCAYSSIEVESGYTNDKWNNQRGGEGDYYTLPDGTLVMLYTGYPIGGAHGDYADNVLKMIQSTDGGYTWGEPLVITEEPLGYSIVSSAVNGLHLSNGRFVLAINYSYETADCHGSNRSISYIAYSDDDGYTWKKSATAVTLPNAALEPVVAELANGDLIMTMRTRKENSIYQTISTDGGITWAQPVRVENMNTPSSTNNVHTHPSTGDLMLVWNDEVYDANSRDGGNGNRDPLSIAISTDNGLTYKNQRNLVDGGATWACIRFFGRSMQLQYSSYMKVIDIAEMYYTREGSKTVADLPKASTPSAIYENGWLTGVSSTMVYSLDGGESWKFCGGTSVQIGEVEGNIMVKDLGDTMTAPSAVQLIGTSVVLASEIGIYQGEVSEAALDSLIAMANEGIYTFKFESGEYIFPKTIELPSNTAIVGDVDTVFMLAERASGKSSSSAIIKIGELVDNVRISDLTLKGYNEMAYCPTYGANASGIDVSYALRVNVDNVKFVGFSDSGIKVTHMGYIFWTDQTYEEKQAYFKGLQVSDCRFEKNYYGINLGLRAEYCEFTNISADLNNVGCVNSGGNNSFVNCLFNNNKTGFYLLCTGKSNPGHGGASACSFNNNLDNSVVIEGNSVGFSFTGCQLSGGKIAQSESCGTVFSACVIENTKLEASGSTGAGIFSGCVFKGGREELLANNNGVFAVANCIDLDSDGLLTASISQASTNTEKVNLFSGKSTVLASDFGVNAGVVSEDSLDLLMAKINEGGYTLKLESGVYILPKSLSLPSNTRLVGGASTVFKLADGAADGAVLLIDGVDNVKLEAIILEGANTKAYCPDYEENKVGLYVNGAQRVNLNNVTARGFATAGLKVENMGDKSLQASNCRFEGNYCGVSLEESASFCQFTNIFASYNNIGCENKGDNNIFVNCSFNYNEKGAAVLGTGSASACSFVGNKTCALDILDNNCGFAFNACNIKGEVSAKNSAGVVFNACLMDGTLDSTGGTGLMLACLISGDMANSQGFEKVDCLAGNTSAVANANADVLSYLANAGKTVEVSTLGIRAGKVEESALDALMELAAEGGYTFIFDGGVYEITKTLVLPSNTVLMGSTNTTITLTGANVGKIPVVSVACADNVRISGLTIKGELTQNYVADQIYSKSGSVGIYISNSSRVALENVRVLNFQDTAVKVESTAGTQISDCRFENSYYGLWLAESANYTQVIGCVAGYCSIGVLESGAGNLFANCAFNKNRYGFYVYHTNFPNAGAGMVINSCFNHNDSQGSNRPTNYNGLQIDNCSSGYIFSGCQLFGNLKQSNSSGVVISSTILGSAKTNLSGNAGSCIMSSCFFQTAKADILAGNNNVYTTVNCIQVP